MEIIACVKRVPLTQEVDLEIAPDGRSIKRDDLVYIMNDWDSYAIEEAIQLKEGQGGTVTAITIGDEDDEDILRRCLAMGADRAIRISGTENLEMDGFVLANMLSAVVKDMEFDLILTGVQAEDDNMGMVGVMMAQRLGLGCSVLVTDLETGENGHVTIKGELEGGIDQVLDIQLPALLTIQTGINEPRYVSIMGIRKARKKELRVMDYRELSLSEADTTPMTRVEELSLPPETEGAEILKGTPEEMAEQFVGILREKGGVFV